MKTIAVDIGTTTIKCALFNDGKVEKFFAKEYSLIYEGKRIMQNPEDWKNIIKEGFSSFGDISDVKGLGISSQGITIIPVDEKGTPITLADSWLDYTAETELEKIKRVIRSEIGCLC